MEMKKEIGLVLSGGGHRGAAHAGAIKALNEYGIYPSIISGTSAGAFAGALYAANYSPEEILNAFKNVNLFTISRYARGKPGFVDTESFCSYLLEYFPENSFESLSKKLYVSATDLVNGTTKVFHEGDLILSILASLSFPGVFTPVAIDNSLFSDGGILDNFPIQPIAHKCKEIYGVYDSPIKEMMVDEFKHSYNVIDRAFHLKSHRDSIVKFSRCNLVIYPEELGNHSLFATNHLDEVFEIGYNAAKTELKKRLSQVNFMEEFG